MASKTTSPNADTMGDSATKQAPDGGDNTNQEETDAPFSPPNSERSSYMAESLRKSHDVLIQLGKDACIDHAFNELDLKKNGVLDRSELCIFLEEAAKHVRLEVEKDLIEDAVDALVEDAQRQGKLVDKTQEADGENAIVVDKKHITKSQFYDMFQRHPDMLRVFDDEESLSLLRTSVRASLDLSPEEVQLEEQEKEEVWAHARTHWKNKGVAIVWLFLYIAGCVTAFTYKAVVYSQNEEAQAVFGECITVARGCAQLLNLNACLILFPICRHFLTFLRGTRLERLFPFDASIEIHILIGIVIALFSLGHVCAHICDFYRFARADVDDIYALFGDKLGVVPDGIGARWKLMLSQPAGITGIIMVVCMLIGYSAIYYRRKRFNVFWYSHHLLVVMLIALCCHGIGNLLEPFQSVYWVMCPLALYIVPRFLRETRCSSAQVVDASVMEGEIVSLKLDKPSMGCAGKQWNHVEAGMYAFLNIPAVSHVEWHPFTLTSAPHEDTLEFAFQAVGDWTGSAKDLFAGNMKANNGTTKSSKDEDIEEDAVPVASSSGQQSLSFPNVKVEGPIGASSQDFDKFPILVLIGAGIGVTPMISVVKHLLKYPGRMRRTFLYWTVRDRVAVDWFESVLDDIYEQDDKHVIQVRHFLTSVKHDDRDLGAVLLHHAARSKHVHTNIDLLLGRQTHHQVQVGRPLWDEELYGIRQEAKDLGEKECGIFLCGPKRMAEEVDSVSFALSREDPNFHFYFNKETF